MTTRNREILIHELNLFKESTIKRYNITDEDYLDNIEYITNILIEFGCEIEFEIERYMMFDTEELYEFIEFYKHKEDSNVPLNTCIKIVEMLFEENLSE